MRKECGNRDFGTALQLLAVNPIEADCMLINIACKGLGTNEFLLSTILCGRSNKDMTALKVHVKKQFVFIITKTKHVSHLNASHIFLPLNLSLENVF